MHVKTIFWLGSKGLVGKAGFSDRGGKPEFSTALPALQFYNSLARKPNSR